MKNAILAFVCGLAALSMTGCRMTRVCNSDGGMEVSQTEGGVADIRADDPCFADWLSVEPPTLSRSGSKILVAGVPVRNVHRDSDDWDREDEFAMQYRFAWFDANGLDVSGDATYWKSVTIHGGDREQFKSTAPNASAVRFVMRMRHVR